MSKMRVLIALVSFFLLCKGQHVEIRCVFGNNNFIGIYGCSAREFLVTQNGTQTVIVGNHLPNQTNLNVDEVVIFDQPIPFVISEFFTNFPSLQTLIIIGGLLQRIQADAFTFAHSLTLLSIINSQLRVLPANFLAGATGLQNLQISNSEELQKIDQNAFYGLNNLTDLSIRNTSIKFLPENVFSTLPNLERLHFTDNLVQTLDSELFHNNFRLQGISLFDNRINAIGRNLVENFANLTVLGGFALSGNICVDASFNPRNITAIHAALQECYRNYEQRRHFELDLQGSLVIRDENGDVIFDAHV